MKILRYILFPFAILYDCITAIRNFLYDKNILKSHSFDLPIIVVGNLSVGGTGKTPQIEYLIRLLSDKYKVATLSRGYKRESKGFILANENSDTKSLGDEPFQFYNKFKNIQVAVDADRKNGIGKLLEQPEKPEIILLDDAFQHRKVKAGFYILLTAYNDLFCDDFLLPTGNLRENRSGCKRANVIIVTKCPTNLSELEQMKIRNRIGKDKAIYFTSITYDDCIFAANDSKKVSEIKENKKILLAGIAKPKPFFDYLKSEKDTILEFSDHHSFTKNEILEIKNKAQNEIIITTEKDYMRLKDSILKEQLYYLPIKSSFIKDRTIFDDIILDFVKQ